MTCVSPDQFSKILSKESSKSYPSFRVYYGAVSGAVPFTWETRPGTPKHAFSENHPNIPPLTPPPSYHTRSKSINSYSKTAQSRSKFLFHSLPGRMDSGKPRMGSSSLNSSSSSAKSSFSGFASRRRRFTSWELFLDERAVVMGHGDDQRRRKCGRPARSHLWGGDDGPSRVGYSVLLVKKALLSIVGR